MDRSHINHILNVLKILIVVAPMIYGWTLFWHALETDCKRTCSAIGAEFISYSMNREASCRCSEDGKIVEITKYGPVARIVDNGR